MNYIQKLREQNTEKGIVRAIGGSMKYKTWNITDRYSPNGIIVEREIKGRISAIRFAPGMTIEEVKQSLINNPPVRSDWRPFNQSTGSFV